MIFSSHSDDALGVLDPGRRSAKSKLAMHLRSMFDDNAQTHKTFLDQFEPIRTMIVTVVAVGIVPLALDGKSQISSVLSYRNGSE
jgi:hypothetical protein